MRWILLSLFALSASAQTSKAPKAPPFTSAPSIEDRNLYYTFFTNQLAAYNNNQSAKASSPTTSSQIDAQTAATLQITVAELPTFFNIVQQTNQSWTQIPTTRPPSPIHLSAAQLAGQDDLRKLEATAHSLLLLSQQLQPSSWKGLHNYILNGFKNSLPKAQQ
jgi:hypothetical protein